MAADAERGRARGRAGRLGEACWRSGPAPSAVELAIVGPTSSPTHPLPSDAPRTSSPDLRARARERSIGEIEPREASNPRLTRSPNVVACSRKSRSAGVHDNRQQHVHLSGHRWHRAQPSRRTRHKPRAGHGILPPTTTSRLVPAARGRPAHALHHRHATSTATGHDDRNVLHRFGSILYEHTNGHSIRRFGPPDSWEAERSRAHHKHQNRSRRHRRRLPGAPRLQSVVPYLRTRRSLRDQILAGFNTHEECARAVRLTTPGYQVRWRRGCTTRRVRHDRVRNQGGYALGALPVARRCSQRAARRGTRLRRGPLPDAARRSTTVRAARARWRIIIPAWLSIDRR